MKIEHTQLSSVKKKKYIFPTKNNVTKKNSGSDDIVDFRILGIILYNKNVYIYTYTYIITRIKMWIPMYRNDC